MNKKSLTKNNGILDRLWRSVGKEHAKCAICETLPERFNYIKLDPHHIIKRGHRAVRWDIRNRIWVCFTHHTGGKKTVEFNEGGWFWGCESDWLGTHRPDDKDYLSSKKHEVKKWTLDELLELRDSLLELKDKSG